ncbi:LCP family protein [Actinomyces sp. ICM47]|uniref:LCP family protein n=1 Tax=Actinomyces sp. ICM47 TaxID=936548 RepID=UPI00344C313E
MSTPPSFTPNPKRRRPGSDDVHVIGQEAPSGAPVPPSEGIAPQMWWISEDGTDASRPLMPPTLDQPQRDPSSLFPRRSAPTPPPSFTPGSAARKSLRTRQADSSQIPSPSPQATYPVPTPASSPQGAYPVPAPASSTRRSAPVPNPPATPDETTVAPTPPSFAPGSGDAATTHTPAAPSFAPNETTVAPTPPSFAPGSGDAATTHTPAAPSFAPGSGSPVASGSPAAPSFAPGSSNAPTTRTPAAPSFAPSGNGPRQVSATRSQAIPDPVPTPGATPSRTAPATAPRPRRKRRRRLVLKTLSVLLVIVLAWGGFLVWDANTNIGRVSALSGASDTAGTTYLLAGSDSRADGAVQDGFKGSERADSIMLVNIAANGQAVALSIPRDTYAEIPGVGWDKINASYAYGGPQLLVETVEKLTGLTVDHFVQIGMGAVPDMVDAVGGVELCYDHDSNDEYSGLNWTAGCHTVDGPTALQFSRMRYQDPEGDIGRTKRQRQVISKVVSEAASPATLINPARTLRVERAGSKSFTVDEDSSIMTVASLVMALRSASSDELMGVPPIESLDYTTSAGASAVLLRDETAPDFFAKLRAGKLTTSDFNQIG